MERLARVGLEGKLSGSSRCFFEEQRRCTADRRANQPVSRGRLGAASFAEVVTKRLLGELPEADAELLSLVCLALVGKLSSDGKVVGAPFYLDVGRGEFPKRHDVSG